MRAAGFQAHTRLDHRTSHRLKSAGNFPETVAAGWDNGLHERREVDALEDARGIGARRSSAGRTAGSRVGSTTPRCWTTCCTTALLGARIKACTTAPAHISPRTAVV